jgi:hypothetical protein
MKVPSGIHETIALPPTASPPVVKQPDIDSAGRRAERTPSQLPATPPAEEVANLEAQVATAIGRHVARFAPKAKP